MAGYSQRHPDEDNTSPGWISFAADIQNQADTMVRIAREDANTQLKANNCQTI